MFHQLKILKSILIEVLMIKHHPHLDMVEILIVLCLFFIVLVNVLSSEKVKNSEDPTSDNESKSVDG